MSALWDSLFGKDGVCIEVIDSCRINYDGRVGWLVVDEGKVVGGYTDVYFYPDNSANERIRLFGGSLFNSKRKECIEKFAELKQKYGTENANKDKKRQQGDIIDGKEAENDEGEQNDQIEGQVDYDNVNNDQNEKYENDDDHDNAMLMDTNGQAYKVAN